MDLRPPPAPAGWYPDPAHVHEQRWWSGGAWTEHVTDSGRQAKDPITPRLLEPNVPTDWIQRQAWQQWGRPEDAVRGAGSYQDAFLAIPGLDPNMLDERFHPVAVSVVRDPNNPHDPNACKVTVSGQHVGHLARATAALLAPLVDAAGVKSWDVAGAIVGGLLGAEYFGVRVWLDRRLTIGPPWPVDA